MRPTLVFLLAGLLAGCTTTDDLLDTILAEGPFGAVLSFDPSSLPEGIDPSEVRLEEITEDLPDLGVAFETGFSPSLRLLPEGIELSAPATLTLPVGSWDSSQRDDPVNDPLAASLAQQNVQVLGSAPAMALANLYQTNAQAFGTAVHNAVTAQANLNATMYAATTQGVAQLYGLDTAATPAGVAAILGGSGNGARDEEEEVVLRTLYRTIQTSQSAWSDFASTEAGHDLLIAANVLPVDEDESTAAAASAGTDFGGPLTYGGFSWVETSEGVWDAQVQTHHFESYSLVRILVDEDGNGIHDVLEGAEDTDGDGTWNPDDWDNDGDRLADETELNLDLDGDGIPAFNDLDRDGDGTDDGLADCDGQACHCGWRVDGDRVFCLEGSDVICEDGEVAPGFVIEWEIVPLACPDPEIGEGATCTQEGEEALQIHHYGSPTSPGADIFCGECTPGTISPATYCD